METAGVDQQPAVTERREGRVILLERYVARRHAEVRVVEGCAVGPAHDLFAVLQHDHQLVAAGDMRLVQLIARRQRQVLGHALQALGNLCVDCRHWQGNAHATLKAAQRFQLYLHVQSLDLKVWEIKARDKKQDGGTFYKNRLNLLFAPIQRYCRRRISQGAAPLARILATKARDEYSTQSPNEQCIARGHWPRARDHPSRRAKTKNRRNLCCAWV